MFVPKACSEDETPVGTTNLGPAQVVREYARSLREGRYSDACGYQAWSQRPAVRAECVRQLDAAGTDTSSFRLSIAAVRVELLTAEVDVYGSAKATIVLKKRGGRWLIESSESDPAS